MVKARQSFIHDTPPHSNGWNPTIDGDLGCWDPCCKGPSFSGEPFHGFHGCNFFIGGSNESNHTPTVSTNKWLTSLPYSNISANLTLRITIVRLYTGVIILPTQTMQYYRLITQHYHTKLHLFHSLTFTDPWYTQGTTTNNCCCFGTPACTS